MPTRGSLPAPACGREKPNAATQPKRKNQVMRSTTPKALSLSLILSGICCLSAKAQPTVVSADPRGDYFSVKVIYSSAMDPASTANTANYSLVNSGNSAAVTITSATLSTDQTTVVLHL